MSAQPSPPEPVDWLSFSHPLRSLLSHFQSSSVEVIPPATEAVLSTLYQTLQTSPESSAFSPEMAALEQRHRTEIHRLLRLLLTDVAFYRAARAPALQQQRHQQMGDRLLQLHQHLQAMIELSKSEPGVDP